MTTSDFSAPTRLSRIDTWGIDELRGLIGFNRIPPDHNGAVGDTHVVSVFNHALQVFDKAGTLLSTQTLDSLFGVVGGTHPVDPNILYDAASDRFVYVSFEVAGTGGSVNPGNDQIFLNVAVSKTSDPSDGWNVAQINAKTVINGVNAWSDFPGVAVDGEAIYITANMFAFDGAGQFLGNRVWIVDKGEGTGGLYDGGAMSFSVHDPIAEAADLTGLGVAASTLIPARIEGDASGASGIYLVAADALKSGLNEVAEIIRIDNPLTGPSFTAQAIVLGDISAEGALPAATQRGSDNVLGSGDGRVWSGGAVEFNGKLYFTFDIAPKTGPDAGDVTVHWVELDASNPLALSLIQQGNIGGENIAPGTHTFMPSIAVNKDGSVLVNFSASGPGVFPGAYYALRADGDPTGQFGPAQTLAPGVDSYFRNRQGEGISGQTTNRWGDFSGAAVDPADGTTFWFFNMFADTSGSANAAGQDGRWRLSIGAARPTILDFQHRDGDADENYYGGLGADGLQIIADASGTDAAIGSGPSGEIVVSFGGGGGTTKAFFIENFSFIGGIAGDSAMLAGALLTTQPGSISFEMQGGAGNDTLAGGLRGDRLLGEAGNDSLVGGGGNDDLDGGDGVDTIGGGAGKDIIDGRANADVIASGPGKDTVDGGTANDRVFSGVGADRLYGKNGDDTLGGGSGKDIIDGGDGNDILVGRVGRDSMIGGIGNDIINGGVGADTLIGGIGSDVIFSGAGDDVVRFGAGDGGDMLWDFTPGAASEDVLELIGFGAAFDSFAKVIAAAIDDGDDTTIDFGAGDVIVIHGVLVADLDADDFVFG